jgi:hypothetical protein
MALPLIPAAAAIASFIARSGVAKAIAKYGEKAVMAAGKTKPKSTKGEIVEGPMQSTSTSRKVRGTKTQAGTEMPPNQINIDAAKAAAKKANKAAQMGRGKTRIKKGLGVGVGAAGTGYTIGEALRLGVEANDERKNKNDKRKNKAEVERLRRLGQRNAFKQAGEREAKKTTTPTSANDAFTKAIETRKKGDTTKTLISNKRTKTPPPAKTNPTGAKNISASRKVKSSTFTGKDGKQKANVTAEELKASGMSLRDYLNKQQGKTRRAEMKKGGPVNKTTKAKKTNKVRGSGIAIRGVRPAKMR